MADVRKEIQRRQELREFIYRSREELHAMGYTDSEIDSAAKEILDEQDRNAAIAGLMHQVVGAEDRRPYERR